MNLVKELGLCDVLESLDRDCPQWRKHEGGSLDMLLANDKRLAVIKEFRMLTGNISPEKQRRMKQLGIKGVMLRERKKLEAKNG